MVPALAGLLTMGVPATALGASVPLAGAAGAPVAEDSFTALACPSATQCLAVGDATPPQGAEGVAAAAWNGSAWAASAPAVPPGSVATSATFLGVSCPSASRCVAVGNYSTDQTQSHVLTLAELWTGSAWQVLDTRYPSSDDHLGGISCWGPSACIAVGGDRGFGGSHLPLAESWNGGAWATMTTPISGATDYDTMFNSVSCTGPDWCMAVGVYDNPAHDTFTLAEVWNGTSWRQLTAPGTGLTSVSCVSDTSCLAVSGDTVQKWNGTAWSVISSSPPAGTAFANVTCRTASDCLVVGGTGTAPLAETWNGSTFQTAPVPSPEPGAALAAAACTAATACVAVGESAAASAAYLPFSMAAYWQGTSWRVARMGHFDQLNSVSCPQASTCLAAGSYLSPAARQVALGEQESGGHWRATAPQPPSPGVTGLNAVSCAAPANCMAVGGQAGDRWNGKSWLVTHLPVSVLSVSCAAPACVAVGGSGAAVWNGTSWRTSSPVVPKGSNATIFTSVSCPTSNWCMAAGQYYTDPHDSNGINLAEVWNGATWRMLAPPQPGQNNDLAAVSCTSSTQCAAVGYYITSANASHPFATVWNGTAWKSFTLAGPNRSLDALSCADATHCLAVGYSTPASGDPYTSQQPTAESWTGGAWATVAVGLRDASFTSVSCPGAQSCTAAGPRDDGQTLAAHWNGSHWSASPTANP